MKKAVFTVNFNNYDRIRYVPKWDGWDSILVRDTPIDNPGFDYVHVVKTDNPQLDSRYYKWMTHEWLPEYDTVIYYDANLELIRKPSQDHFHIIHEVRKSVREEIDALIKLNHRWDRDSLRKQWSWMEFMGFKDDQGLFLNGFFGRDNHDYYLNNLFSQVWTMCSEMTNRDMLALPFMLWVNDMKLPNQVPRSFFSHHVRRPAHKGKHPILKLK